jgi:UDP-N-acetylglucosamine--N-acetylmuramyl-(pentapeptide) pyrophosphoryl-undecaprenol N-acetylglucosamine transferase
VDLVTDERADKYGRWPGRDVHIVPADTFRSKSPIAVAKTVLTLGRGVLAAWWIIGHTKPAVVVGFGGYPSFPPLTAAKLTGTPSILHEANAVMGRANRGLAKGATGIALSWADTAHVDGALTAKATLVGVPVRPPVVAAANTPYDAPTNDGHLSLLVFGGSQGARVFAEIMPPAIALLSPDLCARLNLVQQVREEDMARVTGAYGGAGVSTELAPFFRDLPARMAASHLVVSRSGASTVAELSVIGRPALMVPLPHAIDNDQLRNARALESVGGGVVAEQAGLTPERLAGILTELLSDPARLARMATAARGLGRPDAVERLADLVERLAKPAR